MAASKTRDIRDALVGLIQPLQLDGESAFVEVKGHPNGQFDGFPSVRVLPLDIDREKGAFRQVDPTVAFTVRTHVPEKDDGSDFNYMYELTDLLMDALDEADATDALHETLDSYNMSAARGSWGYEDTQEGVVLFAEINVAVTYSKDL